MSKYYCINFYTKNNKYCSFIVINLYSHETIEEVKKSYTSYKMNQTVFEISKFDYDETKAPFKIKRVNSIMRFKDLYIQLVDEAKVNYPNSEYIQDIDAEYNIGHKAVVELFEPLDMLEWERTNDTDESYFQWKQDIFDMLNEDVIEALKVDFKEYFEAVKDMEV